MSSYLEEEGVFWKRRYRIYLQVFTNHYLSKTRITIRKEESENKKDRIVYSCPFL